MDALLIVGDRYSLLLTYSAGETLPDKAAIALRSNERLPHRNLYPTATRSRPRHLIFACLRRGPFG